MVASTLGVATTEASHDHEAEFEHDSGFAHQNAREELHPWAKEMYRQGLSFNGNERSKLFLGRGDGTFEDLSELCGADSPLDGRGLLCADFDDDGDLDLFVHNLQRERHNLYRNERGGSSFLKVRLRATHSQHEAIGAVVTVDGPQGPTAQVLSRGAGYASSQGPELVFGLGALDQAAVRVTWPGGREESFGSLRRGSTVRLVEGSGAAQVLSVEPFALRDPLPQGLKIDVGEALPSVSLEAPDGSRVDLEWRDVAAGRTLYLNLWASYCRPCIEEIPDLERLHRSEQSTVVSISVDVPASRPAARALLDAAAATYPLYFMTLGEDEERQRGIDELVDLLRLPVPTTLIVAPDGRLEGVVRGPVAAPASGDRVGSRTGE